MSEILFCSNCDAKTQHAVYDLYLKQAHSYSGRPIDFSPHLYDDKCFGKICNVCGFISIYMSGVKVFPITCEAPEPSKYLPDHLKRIYLEAGRVYSISLRASAALIRYCLEMLCSELGGKGDDLKKKINNTIDKFHLHQEIREAAHAIRTIGNSYLHPREINESEDPNDVLDLFHFINLISEQTFGTTKRLERFRAVNGKDGKSNK